MGTGDLHSWIAGCIKREDVTWLKAFSEAKLEADMDGQMKPLACWVLMLSFVSVILLQPASATLEPNAENRQAYENDMQSREVPKSSSTEPKPSIFPKHLDVSSLHDMPMIILHPRKPISLQMFPGDTLSDLHRSLNPNMILELLQSATSNVPVKIQPPINLEHRQARNRNIPNHQPQASVNRPQSVHSDSQSNTPALPRSLLNSPSNNGWFQRFRGSFSNMFPIIKPFKENSPPFGLPTMNLPTFIPHQSPMHGNINPIVMGSHPALHILPWRNFHMPSTLHSGDLATAASYMQPTRMFNNHHLNQFKPAPQHFGGDLAMSSSTLFPYRVPFRPNSIRYIPPVPRHKPLFNNVGGLQAASMEISNAFADFTDSKEHGPEVTQKFGSVGHSITSFLKMMGLGGSMDDIGGFGGGGDLAALDSTPIARSMDFYPGYGNQAHLDNIDDFPIFEEDITQDFMNKMNLTNVTKVEEEKVDKEMAEMKTTLAPKMSYESMEKHKMVLNKGSKTNKETKISLPDAEGISYVSAVPLEKVTMDKNKKSKTENEPKDKKKEHTTERPKVSYKIPVAFSTVAPQDRKQPVAIYQHFAPSTKELPKPPTYAPAQPMPSQEGEENPNKLVDEDVVRQWRLINSGKGYVEKRPVPIIDVLQSPGNPESLKVLQKVLSNTVKKNPS